MTVLPIGRVGERRGRAGSCARKWRKRASTCATCARSPDRPTLFSFCFLYPDGTGGNLTTADSACAAVDPAAIEEAAPDFAAWRGRGIALAEPEVPLEARLRLLELGGRARLPARGQLHPGGDAARCGTRGCWQQVDLLGVNLEEALAAAGMRPPASRRALRARRAGRRRDRRARRRTPRAAAVGHRRGRRQLELGRRRRCTTAPPLPVRVESTGGAGDAHFAGILAGLAAGLALPAAQQLGTLVAAASVTSPHTIHKGITREMLRELAECGS